MESQPSTVSDFLADFEKECPPLVRRTDLKKFGFPLTPQTLANLAALKQGPPLFKVAGRACYRRADLVQFLKERTTRAL